MSPLRYHGFLLGFRRAQAKARRDLDDLADQFEEINDEAPAKLRGLRREMARLLCDRGWARRGRTALVRFAA